MISHLTIENIRNTGIFFNYNCTIKGKITYGHPDDQHMECATSSSNALLPVITCNISSPTIINLQILSWNYHGDEALHVNELSHFWHLFVLKWFFRSFFFVRCTPMERVWRHPRVASWASQELVLRVSIPHGGLALAASTTCRWM